MLSLTAPLSLATTTAELRSGQRDLLAFIREVCDRIDALEPHIPRDAQRDVSKLAA